MPLSKLFLRSLISILFTVTLLTSCQKQQEPLRIALLEWPPYELAFWARENNWFTKENAILLEYKTPAEVTRAFTTGAVDIIAVTSDFALTLMEEYPDTRLITVIDASNGGDTVLAKRSLVKGDSFKDLRIGVESGPLGSYMLARFMDKYSISEGEMKIKYVDIPAQVEMWNSGAIDLLITYEPNRSQLKSQGAFEIFTSKEIPNEIIDVFLIRADKLETQKENLRAFLSGWFKAVDELNGNSPKVFDFIGQRENLSTELVIEIFKDISVPDYQTNLEQLSKSNKEFISGFEKNEEIMLEKKLMTKSVNKELMITDKALLLVGQQ